MKILFYILLIFSIIIVSCTKDNERKTEYVKLDTFNKLIVNSTFDIYLIEDSCFSIEINANETVIENITYTVTDSVLRLDNTTSFKWLSPKNNQIDIYIHSKNLSLVELNQTCHLQTINPITSESFGLILKSKTNQATLELDCNSFYYWNNFPCGGKLTLSGMVNDLKIWNYAILTVDAKELIAKYAEVENNSQSDCTVNVTEKLNYSIRNSGDIYLYGNPSKIIKEEVNSKGKLIRVK